MVTATKILHLVEAFSQPTFLFAQQQNHHLIFFLLETINNLVQYQFDGNAPLVYCVIRRRKVFHQLAALPTDENSIDRVRCRRGSRKPHKIRYWICGWLFHHIIYRHEKLSKIERENREREGTSTPESDTREELPESTDATPVTEKSIVQTEDDDSQIIEPQQVFLKTYPSSTFQYSPSRKLFNMLEICHLHRKWPRSMWTGIGKKLTIRAKILIIMENGRLVPRGQLAGNRACHYKLLWDYYRWNRPNLSDAHFVGSRAPNRKNLPREANIWREWCSKVHSTRHPSRFAASPPSYTDQVVGFWFRKIWFLDAIKQTWRQTAGYRLIHGGSSTFGIRIRQFGTTLMWNFSRSKSIKVHSSTTYYCNMTYLDLSTQYYAESRSPSLSPIHVFFSTLLFYFKKLHPYSSLYSRCARLHENVLQLDFIVFWDLTRHAIIHCG